MEIKFEDKLAQYLLSQTQQLLAGMRSGNIWISYRGEMNASDPEKDIVVYWWAKHGIDHEIEKEALFNHFENAARSIDGFEYGYDRISGNGGSDWLLINLTHTTEKAWKEWTKRFGMRYLMRDHKERCYGWGAEHTYTSLPEYKELLEERKARALTEFWSHWYQMCDYYLPEKYYKDEEFAEMSYDADGGEWEITDQTKFDQRMVKLFLKALNAGDVSLVDVGELSITQCIYCGKWDLTDNTRDYGQSEYAHVKCHAKHLKKVYPKRLL